MLTSCEDTTLAKGWLPADVRILSKSAGITELCDAFANKPSDTIGQQKTNYTRCDAEAMHMICQGINTIDMADKNSVTTKTIEARRSRLYSKTGARNLTSFIQKMVKQGLYDLAQWKKE